MIANWQVATGGVLTPSIAPTRKEEDFATHIRNTIATASKAGWIFIVDQLNTHKSEALVRLIDQCCDLNLDLGEKGKSGILQSMETRAAYSRHPSHRIRFVYVPKHSSWLNQIECWCAYPRSAATQAGPLHFNCGLEATNSRLYCLL